MPQRTTIDIDGSEAVSRVLLSLLNTFPGLKSNENVTFSDLSPSSGISFFPTTGAIYESNKEDICGRVKQVVAFPFAIYYRTGARTEAQRMRVYQFLDALGRWLERQPVTLSGNVHQLEAYPALSSGNRAIKSISRTSPGYISAAHQDQTADWAISLRLVYENEFDR